MKTIPDFENVGLLRDLEIIKAADDHPLCRFHLLLEDTRPLGALKGRIGEKLTVEDQDRILFLGFIRTIEGKSTFLKALVTVEAVSYSAVLDQDPQNRIFQSPDKSYGDIIKIIREKHEDRLKFRVSDASWREQKESQTIVQRQETDFAFLKRIAHAHGLSVFVGNTSRESTEICIGQCFDDIRRKIEESQILTAGFSIDRQEIRLDLRLRDLYQPGTFLQINGKEFLIDRVHIREANDSITCDYRLSSRKGSGIKTEKFPDTYALGPAVVVSREDPQHLGRIQVQYREAEDCVTKDRPWIAYESPLTEKGGGLLFLPDPGEVVEVTCRKGICVASGCLRETAFEPGLQNTADRVLLTRGNTVHFGENEIRIRRGKTEITVADEKITIQGPADISVETDGLNIESAKKTRISSDNVIIKTKSLDIE